MIASLMVVALLVVLAVLLISAVTMTALLAMAATMVRWRGLRRRFPQGRAGREPRLPLKLSGETVPGRLRAELSGGVPAVRRRLRLGGARPGGHGRDGSGPRPSRLHSPADRRTHA
ncbi:hypothetical protein [Nonomuraea aridisoli]|uniref:hypothetical protein n=1 Tax=Nonomuraea aridisoli TaxID=2070368 RepID=UPI0011B9443C|nr:hypothetical protein [Nonomuraea aridisoli]